MKIMKNVPRRTFSILYLFLIIIFLISIPLQATIYYPELTGKSNLLIDADTGVIYIKDNVDEPLAIASLTKLMSTYVFLDEAKEQGLNLNDKVVISQRAAGIKQQNIDNSGVYLVAGDEMTIDELLKLVLIYSDNGAMVALSEEVSGTEEKHVEKINEKAKDLGMDNSTFVNVTGLTMRDYGDYMIDGSDPDDYNTASARDLGKMTVSLVKDYPKILDYTEQTSLEYDGYTYNTYNEMLDGQIQEYTGVRGLKTGTTIEAGECFIGYLQTDSRNYISVVLGVDSDTGDRFTDTAVMYEWIEEQNFIKLADTSEPITKENLEGDTRLGINLYPKQDITILEDDDLNGNLVKIKYNDEYIDESGRIKKDIPENETIVTYYYEVPEDNIALDSVYGKQDFSIELVAHKNINKQNFVFEFITAIPGFFIDFYNSIF